MSEVFYVNDGNNGEEENTFVANTFVAYITAGYPSIESMQDLLMTLYDNGADMIELGIPFSDPSADGEVIQESSMKSLKNGTNTTVVFEQLRHIVPVLRKKYGNRKKIGIMTYINIVNAYGIERFYEKCLDLGINALIFPDVPYEESYRFRKIRDGITNSDELSIISFVSPVTSGKRLERIVKESEGFIYLISSPGITGLREQFSDVIESKIREIKEIRDVPVFVGFGISKHEHVVSMYEYGADGVIVGSAIIKCVAERGIHAAGTLVRELKYGAEN